VFTKHPKSVESWSHRRWVVSQLLASRCQQSNETILQRELDVCEKVARAYPKNYYAWTHRQWILNNLNISQVALVFLSCRFDSNTRLFKVRAEYERMSAWVANRTSDHAGFHYRQSVLLRLTRMKTDSDSQNDDCSLLRLGSIWSSELDVSHQLITSNPGHEALWCHLRFVIYHFAYFLTRSSSIFREIGEKEKDDDDPHYLGRKVALEVDFALNCMKDHHVSNYSDQFTLASRYRFWLLHLADAIRCIDSIRLQSSLKQNICKPTVNNHYFDNRIVSTFDLLSQLPSPEERRSTSPLLTFDYNEEPHVPI